MIDIFKNKIWKIIEAGYAYRKWNILKKKAKIKEDEYLFVEYKAIGDSFLSFCMAKEFKKNHPNRQYSVAISSKMVPIAKWFSDIDRIIEVNEKDLVLFVNSPFSLYIGSKHIKSGDLNLGHPRVLFKLAGVSNFNYFHLLNMQKGQEWGSKFLGPDRVNEKIKNRVYNELSQKGIKRDKGIFLIPSAVSSDSNLYKNFFSKLIQYLILDKEFENYYFVVNEMSNYFDQSLGNKVIYKRPSLEEAYFYATYLGNVISVRTGLADFLSATNVNMLVLYKDSFFGGSKMKLKDFFSLKHINLGANIEEVELSFNDEQEILKIISIFKNLINTKDK